MPPYNKTVSHGQAASVSATEGGLRTMGLNIPVEVRSGSGVTCNKNHSLAAQRGEPRGAWMEEQCTPYINIVPITRSPGSYRSWTTPTTTGLPTAVAAPLTWVAARTPPSCRNPLSGIPAEDSGDEKAADTSPRNTRHVAQ